MGRVAVIPTPIKTPNITHHKLWLIVGGLHVGSLQIGWIQFHFMHNIVQTHSGVHALNGFSYQEFQSLSHIRQHAFDAFLAGYGQAVSG